MKPRCRSEKTRKNKEKNENDGGRNRSRGVVTGCGGGHVAESMH